MMRWRDLTDAETLELFKSDDEEDEFDRFWL